MNMSMEDITSNNKKLNSFVPFPRWILSHLRNGKLTPNEYSAYSYLRLSGDPYGVATTSLEDIRNDVFRGGVGINYCNRLLLSLKGKRYIHYEDRRGRRGSFEVHLGDWILPNRSIKSLDSFFNNKEVRSWLTTDTKQESVNGQSLPSVSKSFIGDLSDIFPSFPMTLDDGEVRGSYNDTDKEKNTDKNRTQSALKEGRKWELKNVSSFDPSSHEESRCKDIAAVLGEEHINGILALLKKHGIDKIESAYGIYREDMAKGKPINNAGAYFRGIVENRAIQNRSP